MDKTLVSISKCDTYEYDKIEAAVRKAVDLTGGLGEFIKPGTKVIIKPNMMAAVSPEKHVTTHPLIVKAVIRLVKELGGIPMVGDSPAGMIGKWDLDEVWRQTGIWEVVEEEGVERVIFEKTKIVEFDTPELKCVKKQYISSAVLEADFIINLPKLKTHSYMGLSGSIKNMFGVVPGKWKGDIHCKAPDPLDFAEIIAKIIDIAKPGLTLVDAVVGLEGEGPGVGGTIRNIGMILGSRDCVALDTVLCNLVGIMPEDVPIIKVAAEKKYGIGELEKIEIVGELIDQVALDNFLLPKKVQIKNLARFTRMIYAPSKIKPVVNKEKCVKCFLCVKSCPVKAISVVDKEKLMTVDYEKCIECCCCYEVCWHNAISIE